MFVAAKEEVGIGAFPIEFPPVSADRGQNRLHVNSTLHSVPPLQNAENEFLNRVVGLTVSYLRHSRHNDVTVQ